MKKIIRIQGIPLFFGFFYSLLVKRISPVKEIYEEIANEVSEKIDSGRLLDVGTGPGFLPFEIAKRAPHLEITGIDISKGMIKIAKKNLKSSDFLGRIKFIQANAENIPFGDEHFDFILSTFSFHHWLSPLNCLREMERILKKGGEIWIYDIKKDTSKETNQQLKKKYGIILYLALLFVKLHSSLSTKKLEGILSQLKGFSQKITEDKGIIVKVKLLK